MGGTLFRSRASKAASSTKDTFMILEIALLNVNADQTSALEDAFAQAQPIISSMRGYVSHRLQFCVETPGRYVLLVHWRGWRTAR